MTNFFIIRNKEKNMYYFGDGSWTKIKDCARKHQHKDCAEVLMRKDNLDYKNCEVIEIPSISDLKERISWLESKLEEGVQIINEWMQLNVEKSTEINQLKQQLIDECKEHREFCKLADKKVKELEAKLAEKEKYIEEQEFAEYKEMFYATQELKEDCELKILELEKQLAEKEKEIERLNYVVDKHKEQAIEMATQLADKQKYLEDVVEADKVNYKKLHNEINILKQSQNQTAIAELEKVKEKLNDYDIQDILSSSSDPYGEFDENCVTTDKINEIIDQQIKSLKGEK